MRSAKQIVWLSLAAICSACSPVEEVSDIQGTRWQNCVFNKPEEMMWTSLFNNYVAKKLVQAYMSCSGKMLKLTPQEMADFWPEATNRFDGATSKSIDGILSKALASGTSKSSAISGKVLGRSIGATLGMFWISFEGRVSCDTQSNCSFKGNGSFSDFWDFDAHQNSRRDSYYTQPGRRSGVEDSVRVAREWMSGRPFQVTSAKVPMEFSVSVVPDSREIRTQVINLSPVKARVLAPSYTPLAYCLDDILNSLPENHNYSRSEIARILSLAFMRKCKAS